LDRTGLGVFVSVFGWSVFGFVDDSNAQQRPDRATEAKTVPVGDRSEDISSIVKQVDKLAVEMTELTTNLKEAINPEDIRQAIKQLNITLQNASKTLSPEGGLNTTAQRTLAKLEDAIEQFRDIMARINRGEGSIGRLINDPVYAEEVKRALENLNLFLNKASKIRLVIDFGAQQIPAYDGARGYFNLSIWPNPTRYYLVGIGIDPRGRLNIINTTTEGSNGALTTTRITQTEFNRPVLTGMLGKVFFHNRLELAAGALYGDGTLSTALRLGPKYYEEKIRFRHDFYSRPGPGFGLDHRIYVSVNPFMTLNLSGGVDSIHKQKGKLPYFFGASLVFDDDDIKSMFSLLL
jgi:phospholipid/cholesterol/gamma-HCH transport system substrate-binding protein